MSDVPTRGATEPAQSWTRAPAASWALRVLAHVLPVLTAWLAVRGTSHWYLRPDGVAGLVAWLVQAIAVSVAVSTTVDHLGRRLLPLAALLNLSLAFPDAAPSRFGIALRAGSVKRLHERLDQVATEGLGDDPQEAARRALDLVASLSAHDRLTRGHTERVRAHADVIARELGLNESERLYLAWGVLLHDIGKLTVPAEILNKEGELTAEEWAALRNHPAAGQALLTPLAGWLDDWVRAAGEHHERWDGQGYPGGLAGTAISLAGRITAVADAYDVITSTRSYKKPMSATAARQELVRCSGTQFDPAVVRAFLSASVGRRWHGGPLAWLAELPSLGRLTTTLTNSAGAATAGAAAVVVGITGIGAMAPVEEPAQLAMTSPPAVTVPIATGTGSTEPPAVADPVEAAVGVAVGPDGASETTTATSTEPTTATTTAAAPGGARTVTTATTRAPATTGTASPPASAAPTTAAAVTTTAPPPPTTHAPTTTAPPATTATTAAAPAAAWAVYLTNPGSGDTWSNASLSLSSTAPTAGSLPNYDTDRDSTAGLRVRHDSGGLDTSRSSARQDWYATFSSSKTLTGAATVTLWVADETLRGNQAIGVRVGLYRCGLSCTLVASGDWTGTSQEGAFQAATVNLGNVSVATSWGSSLRLRVVAPDALASGHVSLAYDTAAQPARLAIG